MCDSPFVLTPQAVWIACNKNIEAIGRKSPKVSIPQAVLIACNSRKSPSRKNGRVVSIPQAVWIACNCIRKMIAILSRSSFNTASGMDCMQCEGCIKLRRGSWIVSIPQAVLIACNSFTCTMGLRVPWFQYRKRYGLHAIYKRSTIQDRRECFNTASGMDCMQFLASILPQPKRKRVSIPQAVWIACNN